jgi:hypothetical protein
MASRVIGSWRHSFIIWDCEVIAMNRGLVLCVGFALLFGLACESRAAVGCTLNDPDRDIRRIFKEATNYRTDFITIAERGGETLRSELERRLGDKLDPLYEANDVPYATYTVLKGEEEIGRVHGVNQKGMFGGMQLILATDMTGKVIAFYYQKLTSPETRTFRAKSFTDQFVGVTLATFAERTKQISDPSKKSGDDFKATLRGLFKNLILLDLFHNQAPTGLAPVEPEIGE